MWCAVGAWSVCDPCTIVYISRVTERNTNTGEKKNVLQRNEKKRKKNIYVTYLNYNQFSRFCFSFPAISAQYHIFTLSPVNAPFLYAFDAVYRAPFARYTIRAHIRFPRPHVFSIRFTLIPICRHASTHEWSICHEIFRHLVRLPPNGARTSEQWCCTLWFPINIGNVIVIDRSGHT